MGRDYRQPRKFEYESLASNEGSGVQITQSAPFAKEVIQLITLFKGGVLSQTGEALALKYSGLLKPKGRSGQVLMLGWDHAAYLQRDAFSGRYFLRAVYSHSYSGALPETQAHRLVAPGRSEPLCDAQSTLSLPKDKHHCGGHKNADCVWRKYTLPPLNSKDRIWIEELITFSVTSCSFVALWDESKEHLFVSHMAFSPIIPVAWLALEELKPIERAWMRMIASVNSSVEEMKKVTQPERFPGANRLAIDSVLLLRGREGRDVFMTHPYLGLDLSQPNNVKYQGALGYNNDSTRGFRELPPFHSILADLYPLFTRSQSAKEILDATVRLLQGEYGYAALHHEVLNQIALADHVYYMGNKQKHFSAPRLDNLLYQLTDGLIHSGVPVPQEIVKRWGKQGARAAFLLAELCVKPDAVPMQWLKEAVLDAWDRIQRGFELQIKHHDKW
ncbi:hypothetical protein CYFUS_005969 [Cystobacter fuscus]|uniref:Uncharacterized protein n=1 Tax=Cystobacter fuscus TaxID=43 RepID=A0A250JAC3_9BACT|nr:hypothetical protein [Cystobacter fuscus]ATB40520.1 hypothetical protein CYFUS_005969 [Cystobacter fuscus]